MVLALALGCAAAVDYARLGLTLSHYDARGHLVVARRVLDSLTPGWQQLGAVWLPLPHLLNLFPVHMDVFYRTGLSGVAISVVSFSVATASIASLLVEVTGSRVAAALGALTFSLNPNVLYLQATPMTEPLLLGLTLLGLARLAAWSAPRGNRPSAAAVGWPLALACLTRYEAWPVTAAGIMGAAWGRWRAGEPPRDVVAGTARIGVYPAAALAFFAVFSRVVVGHWFVSDDFFVPENEALGRPVVALAQIGWGIRALSSQTLVVAGATGLAMLAARALLTRTGAASGVALAAAATTALPLVAFIDGHPYRIRYMVPLIAAEAVGVGVAAGWILHRLEQVAHRSPPRAARVVGPVLAVSATVLVAVASPRPFDHEAPMVVEAQWDRPNSVARRAVTDCLLSEYRGETIMASMGSLGHYMQELSVSGIRLRDFLHEGNGDIWLTALDTPRAYAGWMLIEEKAEGGDMLAHIARERPAFLDGFTRVCESAGVALFRRGPVDPVRHARSVRQRERSPARCLPRSPWCIARVAPRAART